jgi:hypothetical protein
MDPMSLAQVWMHTIEFSFETFFCNLFEFPITVCTHQKFNNIVHILGLKITKSTIKSNLVRAFQQYQEHPQIPM